MILDSIKIVSRTGSEAVAPPQAAMLPEYFHGTTAVVGAAGGAAGGADACMGPGVGG